MNVFFRDGAVDIPTSYRREGRGSIPGKGRDVFFSTASRRALGLTQPLSQSVPGAISPGIKLPGR
jgi:hypothetical protein